MNGRISRIYAGECQDRYDNTFTFYLKDESGGVEKVAYHGTMPVNFAEAEKIVVEGRMGEETFRAESILVKCPSKYNNQPT